MNANAIISIKEACHDFARVAAPFIHIEDETHYREALGVIESLLEEAEDTPTDPLNAIIELLANAIEKYESRDADLGRFSHQADGQPVDLALLRLLMDQHSLGVADLPEIGSKSMVSRVLSGERSLNKKHIEALSKRFHISPALFFASP